MVPQILRFFLVIFTVICSLSENPAVLFRSNPTSLGADRPPSYLVALVSVMLISEPFS